MNMTHHYVSTAGFTLIETLIAISIIMLATAGPLVSANRALVATQLSKQQLVAQYLAQEGIEYVRAIRDNKYLLAYSAALPTDIVSGYTGTAWESFTQILPQVCNQTKSCVINDLKQLEPCSGSACGALYVTAAGGYVQSATNNTLTSYTRTIQTGTTLAGDVIATSTVSWNVHGVNYNMTATDYFTPWQ